jgi:carbonic anhydrase/acetyltransferase-like protein (isoleucine patch superfamily)
MMHPYRDRKPSLHASVFVAWNAEVTGDVEAGEGASIWYGAVIRGDLAPVRIGPRTNIQDGAVLHVVEGGPCVLGQGITVGHGAIVHACTVGDNSLVGMGAILLDGAEIGSDSIVGAGALVTQGKKYPPRSMILGSPAKMVRTLTDEEVASLHEHARKYTELARATRENGAERGPGPSSGPGTGTPL